MPLGEPAGFAQHGVWRRARVTILNILHGLVMEEEEGGMEAGEHEVLIIARVGNDGRPSRGAVKAYKEPTERYLERGGVAALECIQIRIVVWPPAIDRVQVEGRCARIDRGLRLRP